jgi:hypothetical protein
MKLTFKWFGLCSLVLAGALFSGCVHSLARTSKYMAVCANPPASPPAGKALVCIHRQRALIGCKAYVAIWEDTNFIADLGSGHSVACICDPGKHYFVSTSGDPGCVEAELLADQIYDLRTGPVVFALTRLDQDQETRRQVAEWTRENRWIKPAPAAVVYEQAKQDRIRQLIESFISGSRKDKLQHLAPEDHR